MRMALVLAMVATSSAACGQGRNCVTAETSSLSSTEGCPRFGVSTPGGPGAVAELRAVSEAVGRAPSAELWFVDFAAAPPIGELEAVRARGAEPVVTWEPWRSLGGGEYDRTEFSMAQIAAGVHDDHLYRWADELRDWGGTVYLRFAHEANGDWYPWSEAGGTPPGTYTAAWRHVHDLFRVKQAHNVRWLWAVNVPHQGGSPIEPLYPGHEYVDVVGLDGYNWGDSQPWGRWQSPEEIFGAALDEVRSIAPDRPVVITEVASAEAGGSKPTWIGDLIHYLDDRPQVSAFIWFDHLKEADWRVTSSPGSAAALAAALRRA